MKDKTLILSAETGEGREIYEINGAILEAMLPTDIEAFINVPLRLEYRTSKQMIESEIVGEIAVGHASDRKKACRNLISYRKEVIKDIEKEIAFIEKQASKKQ